MRDMIRIRKLDLDTSSRMSPYLYAARLSNHHQVMIHFFVVDVDYTV